MLLRCLQSTGGSSVIAMCVLSFSLHVQSPNFWRSSQGTIGDIASPSERAGFSGFGQLGPNAAPALGPVIGSLLAEFEGWHSVFVFLAVSAAVVWVAMLLFFPETLRARVGDGKCIHSTNLVSC